MGKYELYQDASGAYRFRLKTSNGEKILASEAYVTKAACQNGIKSVQSNCKYSDRYERLRSVNEKYYFNLRAVNHQVIGTSQMYSSKFAMESGIASVMINGVTTVIIEV